MFKKLVVAGSVSAMLCFGAAAQAQTKWDMPTGYPANNFHTENIRDFVGEIDKATAGKLKITVHDSGSLYKANEIKRAVQGGQADIGEIIISNFSNEDPMFGLDSIPFLATGYEDAQKLWKVSKAATEARLGKQGLKVLYSVPWPPQGIFSAKPISSAADLKGVKWRAYNPNTSRIAQLVGAQPVTIQVSCARQLDTVLLKVASRCNLDCSYCYVYHMGDEAWRDQPDRCSAARFLDPAVRGDGGDGAGDDAGNPTVAAQGLPRAQAGRGPAARRAYAGRVGPAPGWHVAGYRRSNLQPVTGVAPRNTHDPHVVRPVDSDR